MHPILFHLPAWLVVAAAGAFLGLLCLGTRLAGSLFRYAAASTLGALAGLACGWWQGWLNQALPVRSYGALILLGFLLGVYLARRRARLIGVDPEHCTDVGILGVVGGVAGARLFHVVQFWGEYSPFGPEGFSALVKVFKLWEGGLVFYGAFVTAILVAVLYCRRHRLPVLAFLDLAAPSLIAGQAVGRLGCFLFGCCYGRVCELPWAVRFPAGSEPHRYLLEHLAPGSGAAGLHPTQLYAFLGGALAAAFLYAYWPRRRFDGQIFGLMLVLAGSTRFFEEVLRADTPAFLPALAVSLSVAQWLGLGLAATGCAWLVLCARRSASPAAAPV